MYLIHVIPLGRGIAKESLSYFTSAAPERGSLVSVPLRSKNVPAIVLAVESVEAHKGSLKAADFAIRKLGALKARPIFTPAFIEAASLSGRQYAGTTGAVLHSVIPRSVLEAGGKLAAGSMPKEIGSAPEKFVLQADDEERLAHYKSLVREEFARQASLLYCLPSIQEIEKTRGHLEKGIKEYTYVLHSALSEKEVVRIWNAILAEPHPVLIIATPAFLGIPRPDIRTIVVEKESSSGYKTLARPYLDLRFFAEMYAKEIGARLILGDLLLRVETVYRHRQGELLEMGPFKFRTLSTAYQSLIDMRPEREGERVPFQVLSDEVQTLLSEARESHEHTFIYTARRGLAPSTVCGDCETIVTCTECGAPLVLHKSRAENFFLCHTCGARSNADVACRNCGGWKLVTLGVGSDRVLDAIEEAHPDLDVFKIDSDSTKSHAKARDTAERFYATPASVLVGTEMALPYLSQPVDNGVIASIDSLFGIPDFRISQKIFHTLLSVRVQSTKRFIIQTRMPQPLFDEALRGNSSDFFRGELEMRKKFNYPPFSTIVKISVEGKSSQVVDFMEKLEQRLADYMPYIFPALIKSPKGVALMHAIIKVSSWPDQKLMSILAELPPSVTIRVDPDTLL